MNRGKPSTFCLCVGDSSPQGLRLLQGLRELLGEGNEIQFLRAENRGLRAANDRLHEFIDTRLTHG